MLDSLDMASGSDNISKPIIRTSRTVDSLDIALSGSGKQAPVKSVTSDSTLTTLSLRNKYQLPWQHRTVLI